MVADFNGLVAAIREPFEAIRAIIKKYPLLQEEYGKAFDGIDETWQRIAGKKWGRVRSQEKMRITSFPTLLERLQYEVWDMEESGTVEKPDAEELYAQVDTIVGERGGLERIYRGSAARAADSYNTLHDIADRERQKQKRRTARRHQQSDGADPIER